MSVPKPERAPHRPPALRWPARLAAFGALAVLAVASVAARTWLAPWLADWASRLTHGSPTWMFTAGWATTGLAPAAVSIFLIDGSRRDRQLGDNPLERPRAARGHSVPGLGPGYWIPRLPLILVLLVAAVYTPIRNGGTLVAWPETPGGDSFRHGWHLSLLVTLPALITLLILRLLALRPGSGDRALRVAGPLAAATPALALIGLSTSTH
jgi:hypothetical protein